jgi:hypothetical protein
MRLLNPSETVAGGCPRMAVFSELFLRWSINKKRRDSQLEAELKETLHKAWTTGDENDRICVLDYIFLTRDAKEYNILMDAMTTKDLLIADHAEAIVSSLLDKDIDLGPDIREVISQYSTRFTANEMSEKAVLDILDAYECRKRSSSY